MSNSFIVPTASILHPATVPIGDFSQMDVRDDAMDACVDAPIYAGMRAWGQLNMFCREFRYQIPIKTGDICAFWHGRTLTIRRLAVYFDRIELSPESTDSRYKKFVVKLPLDKYLRGRTRHGGRIGICGVVYGWGHVVHKFGETTGFLDESKRTAA